jgi:hypothetical protein
MKKPLTGIEIFDLEYYNSEWDQLWLLGEEIREKEKVIKEIKREIRKIEKERGKVQKIWFQFTFKLADKLKSIDPNWKDIKQKFIQEDKEGYELWQLKRREYEENLKNHGSKNSQTLR